ncbi:MAG: metallophosphoesterase family protein [Candidatus Aenigmarchaeota archaeon]|nr:metallophosphoesterase family protein [Candidatus Aenigmarchaeota archaeon]MDW8149146.1 metallophosphoesterase family protein [Candidatus Aenigmarchaeota archaeon]
MGTLDKYFEKRKEEKNKQREKTLIDQLHECLLTKKEISIDELKKEFGEYTSTKFLDLLEDVAKTFKIPVYYNRRRRTFSLEKINENFISIFDLIRKIRIGFVSQLRLPSPYSSISALYAAYSIFRENDVIWVNCIGAFNDTMGYKRSISRLKEYDVRMEDLERRIDYVAKIYPELKNVKTHILPTKRDNSVFKVGKKALNLDQISLLCEKRQDIREEKREFQLVHSTNVRIYLLSAHNDDGVSSTYTLDAQERIEKLKLDKEYVNIVAIGGYHIPFILPGFHEADLVVSLPSIVSQTPYMKETRKVRPTIGCCILELNLGERDENGKRKVESIKVIFYDLERYFNRKDIYKVPIVEDETERKIISFLAERGSSTLGELSRNINLPMDKIERVVKNINEKYKDLNIEKEANVYTIQLPFRENFEYPQIKKGKKLKFLFISDTHINSKYTNMEEIEYVIKKASEEKVNAIFHTGDILESIPGAEIYEGQRFDLNTKTAEDAMNTLFSFFNIVEKYKIPLFFITGNHEARLRKQIGMDIIKLFTERYRIERGTNLINFVEHNEKVVIDGLNIVMIHPTQGSAETLGTNARKFYRYLKSLGGEEKKTIVLLGNYHKALFIFDGQYFPLYLVPCLKYPDEFSMSKAIVYQKGAWIVTVEYDEHGIISIENVYLKIPNIATESKKEKEIKVNQNTFYIKSLK